MFPNWANKKRILPVAKPGFYLAFTTSCEAKIDDNKSARVKSSLEE
jgi:hypothetical protein